jgi:hypothetical protein
MSLLRILPSETGRWDGKMFAAANATIFIAVQAIKTMAAGIF